MGVIGFVGVICPHAVKKLLGQDHRHTVTASALAGSLLLLLADTVSRSLGSGSALPVGAITSLLGAPFFLAVIFSRGGMGMLDIRGLRFRYGKARPGAVRVDLTLEDGRIGILLGQNGAGKTTLFKLLLGLEKPESGTILFDGQDLTRLSPSQRAQCVGYVPQHIHFGALTVYDAVLLGRVASFGLRAGKSDHDDGGHFGRHGAGALAGRTAETLSGGEKQKRGHRPCPGPAPRLLIFDEPTGNLDLANEALIIQGGQKGGPHQAHRHFKLPPRPEPGAGHGRHVLLPEAIGAVCHTGGAEVFTPEVIESIQRPTRVCGAGRQKDHHRRLP